MVKISAFYLDKQKSFIHKNNLMCTMFHIYLFFQPTDAVLSRNFPSVYGIEETYQGLLSQVHKSCKPSKRVAVAQYGFAIEK
jgi:hypothetical protein